jgi:hypothetical protein
MLQHALRQTRCRRSWQQHRCAKLPGGSGDELYFSIVRQTLTLLKRFLSGVVL